MKVLFLDFDGVILTLRTCISCEFSGWSSAEPDPVLCRLIERACISGMKLVISSTWRDVEKQCKDKLKSAGLIEHLHEDWRTPQLANSRPAEIADWLSRHPEVLDYRIADDDHFEWTKEQESKWLRCHPYDGMMAREMRELAEWTGLVKARKVVAPDSTDIARYSKAVAA